MRENGAAFSPPPAEVGTDNAWGASPTSPVAEKQQHIPDEAANGATATAVDAEKAEKGKEKEGSPVRKFRGVPEDVQLFEVFWKQVVELIKVSISFASPSLFITRNLTRRLCRLDQTFQYKTSLRL